MKTISFLILFLIFSFTCKSQNYFPLPDSNAIWKVVWYTIPGYYYEEHFEYFTDGDTLLYDTLYTKIKKIEYNVFCSFDTLSIKYAGAFRNDTVEKKVFYIPPMPPIKKILYDFSLNVGDTVPDSFQNVMYPWLTVKDIDTVYINDEPRKRFTYWDGPHPLGFQFFVFEGIGSDIGLLEDFAAIESLYYLKCFHNENILEYMDPGDTTCKLESDTCLINSLIHEEHGGMYAWGHGGLEIWPNPASDRIYIMFRQNNLYRNPSRERELEIFNVFGEKVAGIKMSIFQESYSQNVSSLAPGLYLVVIREKQNFVCTGKFLIAR